jgi:hypothetical protein
MNSVPWLRIINTNDWNTSQAVYPRTVSILRMKDVAGTTDVIGDGGYSGAEQGSGAGGETLRYSGLSASIEVGAAGRTTKAGELPADAVTKPIWNIFIPAAVSSLYQIRDRDIVLDDEGYRYEVATNFWTGLGYELTTVRLEG